VLIELARRAEFVLLPTQSPDVGDEPVRHGVMLTAPPALDATRPQLTVGRAS
jgi:hypothetical protein